VLSGSSPGTGPPRGATSGAILAPGTWLGKHQLLHRLAVGGMAEIYLARATGIEQFEKLLVLKRMLPQYAGDHRFIRMFLDEARLAATLSHPNIAHVYDIGGSDGHYYFTMEYVHGEDLAAVLRAGRAAARAVPIEHALAIASGVAAGLHAAHERRGDDGALLGVVHRDVSPSNVLVGYDGCVKIVDFGIAKLAAQDRKTRTGGFLGKARYTSPEHAQGQPLDRRSDVFALGIVLFELTCGRRPFDGETDFAVMQAIVGGEPPRPSALVPGYPAALEAIVLRALQRDREARFATAQALQLALEAFARHSRLALSSVALAGYMGELFGEKIAAWREARQAGRSLSEHVVATATGGTVDLAALDADAALPSAAVEDLASPAAAGAASRPGVARRALRWLAIAAASAAAAIAIMRVVQPGQRASDAAPLPRIEAGPAVAPQAPTVRASAAEIQAPPAAAVAPVAPVTDSLPAAAAAPAPSPPPAASRGASPHAGDAKRANPRPTVRRGNGAADRPARAKRWDPDSPLEP
jgi:tRNA A-37 threonylcarbamoyl transferase component Bud32